MTTQEIEIAQPSTLLAISIGQSWFTEKQLAALNHMGVEDAPRGDLAVFLHQCQRTGLDPFAKQIYMIGRKSKGEMKWTIQTGIDGYRVLGDRVAERRGDVIEHDEPLWGDGNGVWHDLWLDVDPPTAAKYTIIKNGKRHVATVMYREFLQTNYNGEPNAMWSKMPCNQLAKCAEVQAWKKVYPNDFAGLIHEDAAQPTDTPPAPQDRSTSRLVTAEDVLARNAPNDKPEPETGSDDGGTTPTPGPDPQRLNKRMHILFGKGDCTDRDDRLIVTRHIIARDDITSSNDLEPAEIQALVDQLGAWERAGKLGDQITDILNTAAIREAEAQEAEQEPEG